MARRSESEYATKVPRALAREWDAKLKASGFRDIEYEDGSLLGISMQEAERAPDIVELDATAEYYSRALEYLHARSWRGAKADHRIWSRYADGASIREIASATSTAQTTIYRAVERLRALCDAWWEETREERENPAPSRGRPRLESPRRFAIIVRLTRDELHVIDAGAERAGATRSHARRAWARHALISSAQSVPYGPRKQAG